MKLFASLVLLSTVLIPASAQTPDVASLDMSSNQPWYIALAFGVATIAGVLLKMPGWVKREQVSHRVDTLAGQAAEIYNKLAADLEKRANDLQLQLDQQTNRNSGLQAELRDMTDKMVAGRTREAEKDEQIRVLSERLETSLDLVDQLKIQIAASDEKLQQALLRVEEAERRSNAKVQNA